MNGFAREGEPRTGRRSRIVKPRTLGAAIAQGRARATLAANIPERKTERRIREQARSYKIFLSKPRIVGAAIAQGCARATLAANIPERKA